jgi:hypothetical protein
MTITLDGTTGITTPTTSTTGEFVTSVTGFKNRIINGAMGIWQRGTSFTGITNSPTYTADRWGGFVSAIIAGEQVIQSSSTPSSQGFKYSAAFGRTAANTNTNSIWFVQLIESVNMLDLAGQSVTLSFWAKSGANYSGGNLSILVNSGTSADQSLATFSGGPCTGYTGNASVINGSQALTTTWTKYTFTGSVGSTAQEIGVAFGYTPTGTAGADDNIYITGVQLEKGSTATSFDYRDIGTELLLCERYYQIIDGFAGIGNGGGTSVSTMAIFPVTMRTSPSVGTTAALRITDPSVADYTQSSANASIVASRVSSSGIQANLGNFTGLTQRYGYQHNIGSNSITLSAEL